MNLCQVLLRLSEPGIALSRLLKRQAASRPAPRRPRPFRPRLHELEDRCVPSIDPVFNNNGTASVIGSLGFAVAHANPGDTIQFDPSIKGQTIALTQMLDITKDLTIDGAGSGITVSGGGMNRVFQIDFGIHAVINGLKIADGAAPAFAPGGGIYNFGFLTLSNSTVTGSAAVTGGGIANANTGTMIMRGDTVSNNHVDSTGGGIDNSGKLTIINCTIAANKAENGNARGGGISNSGVLMMADSTVARNGLLGAGSDGAGIFTTGELDLLNTIVFNPNISATQDDVLGKITLAQGSLFGSGTSGIASGGDLGGNQFGVDPLLGSLQDNGGPTATMALQSGSPAIGNGASTSLIPGLSVPTVDQRGEPRSANGGDIGAFQTPPQQTPPPPQGPVDVTPQVSVVLGRMRRHGGRYWQTLTLRNNGAALQGPLYLVVDQLTRKVRLRQPAGLTHTDAPLGDPFVRVSTAGQVFGSGQTRTLVLTFGNPLGRKVHFNLRVLDGSGQP
jgi:hypothetical protein